MQADRRKAIKNSVMAVIYQVINLTVAVFLPRWIIYEYGSDVNGLTSNINQYLAILNLLQAGLLAASAFDMYKPVAEGDSRLVGKIFYSAKHSYSQLSYIFFVLAVVIIPIALGGRSKQISMQEVFLAVIMMAVSGSLNFRYFCSFDLIFTVHQDKYVLSISQLIERIIYYIGVYVSIALDLHFLYMYFAHIIGTVAKLVYLQSEFQHRFEKNIYAYKNQIEYKPKSQSHVLINQTVFRAIDSLPIVVVTQLYDLSYASIYSIYIMISNVFKTLFDAVHISIAPSMGILFAEGNKTKCSDTFDFIQTVIFFLLNVVSICISILLLPFIAIYIGDGAEQNYICNNIAVWISIYTVLSVYFSQFDVMVNVTGTYNLTYKSNIVLGLITVVVTILCAFIDYQLIFAGISVFYFIANLLRYNLINSRLFPLSKKCMLRPVITVFLFICTYSMLSVPLFEFASLSFLHWLLIAVVSGCCGIIISLVFLICFDRKQLRKAVSILISK